MMQLPAKRVYSPEFDSFSSAIREGNLAGVKNYFAADPNNITKINDPIYQYNYQQSLANFAYNTSSFSHETALMRAAFNGDVPIVKALLAISGIDINAVDRRKFGQNAIGIACDSYIKSSDWRYNSAPGGLNGLREVIQLLLAIPNIEVTHEPYVGTYDFPIPASFDFSPFNAFFEAKLDLALSNKDYKNVAVLLGIRKNQLPFLQVQRALNCLLQEGGPLFNETFNNKIKAVIDSFYKCESKDATLEKKRAFVEHFTFTELKNAKTLAQAETVDRFFLSPKLSGDVKGLFAQPALFGMFFADPWENFKAKRVKLFEDKQFQFSVKEEQETALPPIAFGSTINLGQ